MPLTWDHSGPGINPSSLREPSSAASSGHIPISQPEVTDRSQPFEPADFDAEGVRTIITSEHTEDDLQQALDAFEKVGRKLGLV